LVSKEDFDLYKSKCNKSAFICQFTNLKTQHLVYQGTAVLKEKIDGEAISPEDFKTTGRTVPKKEVSFRDCLNELQKVRAQEGVLKNA